VTRRGGSAAARGGQQLIVDRLEGDLVVVELDDGRTLDLPRWMLPPGLREGDVVRATTEPAGDGWRVETRVDPEETARRRSAAQQTLERLAAKDPGGDITL
jgi:hypothetical protein